MAQGGSFALGRVVLALHVFIAGTLGSFLGWRTGTERYTLKTISTSRYHYQWKLASYM